ncbi:Bug family tripartite tricarboxylate transporter substrate binding protein [Pseudorhodoferax sp.]|uniref:Bug family tripartite tricarboxylate transporter substrate binding protein n=1 Tax=Pseudorhodoferax sp. TaxID=1993553 RepID=UPI0039E2F7BD
MHSAIRRNLLAATALAALGVGTGAQAQNETIRLVVGYAAGGPVDQTARILSPLLAKELGATVVVDNKGGAGGTLAGGEVARARPDGTTLWLAASPTVTISPNVMRTMQFDPARDLVAVAPVLSYYNVLVAHPGQPYRNVQELVAHAKAHPGSLSYGSSGVGSSNHLGVLLFAKRAGIELNHIPYKGNAPAVADLMGGQISMMMDIVSTAMPHIQSGKVRPIALMAPQRNPSLPDVPTFAEAGLKGLDIGGWYGVYAPKAVPAAQVERFNKAFGAVLAQPGVQARLKELGYEPWSGQPAVLAERAAKERATWATVTQGIQVD